MKNRLLRVSEGGGFLQSLSNVYGNGTEGIYAYGASTVEVIKSAIIKNGGDGLFSGFS